LSACGRSAESNPLTPLVDACACCARAVRPGAAEAQSCEPVPAGARQCADIPELEVPSTGEDLCERPFERPPRRAATAGRRSQSLHVFIDVRKPRLDPCPLAIRERLQGRVRHFGFCRWMFPRARPGPLEHPAPRGWSGRLPCWTASRLTIRQPPKGLRVRGREHRASTLPTVIAHGEDFAPTPIASGTSCRGYRLFPVRSDMGRERCRQRRARLQGSRGERVVRRPISAKKSDVHQPEGPSVVGRSRCERGGVFPNRRAARRPRPAPFSPSNRRAGDARTTADSSAF
jgi:hypothetical protein